MSEILVEQPDPTNTDGDIWTEIINSPALQMHLSPLKSLCIERRRQGISRYGRPLGRQNGRNHLFDAFQELLDAAVYMKAADQPDWKEPLELALMLLFRMGYGLPSTNDGVTLRLDSHKDLK